MKWPLPYSTRNFIAALHDCCMAAIAFVLANYLRLGSDQYYLADSYIVPGTLMFTAICIIVFVMMRLYRGLWRYASLPDLVALTRAISIAVAAFTILMFVMTRLEGIPRSLPVILWLLLLVLLGAPRFLYRAMKDRTLNFDFMHDASKQVPLIVVGATPGAELLIRESRQNIYSPYRVVGLIDDNPSRQNAELLGIRVFGGIDKIPQAVAGLERKGLKPQRIILTGEDEGGKQSRKLLEIAESLGMAVGRLPSLSEFKDGVKDKPDIRPIAIEDLLGRAQNVHAREGMHSLIKGKCVVITGAGGSIGSELCRQVAACSPAELCMLEQNEYALYKIDREMAESFPGLAKKTLLLDVRDTDHLRQAFKTIRPELVFHTAAIKHVPLSESNPIEAIRTNVFGTVNVANACLEQQVSAMVLISTDKAVNPGNIMGATKRLAESYCQALGEHSTSAASTRFFTVRFGNVLGSTGSVVPLFTDQLAKGGPITVTHPDMVRYFMTVREAVELVIQAAALGLSMKERHEAIFVLDMGTPVRITDLAVQMIRLSGLRPGKDIEIVYTGLRPGEKLFEELFYDAENVKRTELSGILLANAVKCELGVLQKSLEALEKHCRERNAESAVTLLKSLVPEYNPQP